jgi:transposase-like protein
MVNERGLDIHHTTVFRWVQEYSPEIDKRFRVHLRPTNDSWRVDETYILVKGSGRYLYRAVDSQGNTLDLIVDYLTEHGVMAAALLYGSPFTDITPQGPDGLFTSSQVDELISLLKEVYARAVA